MKRFCLLLIFAVFASGAYSKELGTFGEVYEVREQDLMQRLAYETTKPSFQKQSRHRQEKVKTWLKNTPEIVSLPRATKTKIFFVQHELLVTSDLKAPVFVDKKTGDMVQTPTKNISEYRIEHRLIARKGDRHPITDRLKHQLQQRFLIFNPDNKRQRAFAKAAAGSNELLTLVTTHGNIFDLAKEMGKPVYLLYPSLQDIFRFNRTPAFAGQTVRKGEKMLFVIEMGPELLGPKNASSFVSSNWDGPVNATADTPLRKIVKEIDPKAVMRKLGGPKQ